VTRLTTGTSSANGGLEPTTRWDLSFKIRWVGFSLAGTAVALLIILIDTSIWDRQALLKAEFADIKAERFYFAANFRVRLRQIRESWLDLYLTGDPVARDAFHRTALDLQK